ncbi:hypothetical protein ANCDUO_10883 [Ancylostoma duodenale]|uniref:Uncharacterized protein n=1 Tax=Ancylostoma duodenale TaxID=51022 RepID=A0A0C2D9J9_9BILA|nr:hypothetical protein ANCDUO_10883 [Ancylostoma duodenale]
MAFEALVLAQSLVFTIGYISKGEALYNSTHTFFSEIVSWEFLIPIVAVQVTLLLMNLVSFLAIRCVVPYFLLPYIAMSVFSLFIATALIGVTSTERGSRYVSCSTRLISLIYAAINRLAPCLCFLFFSSYKKVVLLFFLLLGYSLKNVALGCKYESGAV